ncbi:Ribosome biogenesis protein YTM1 [Stylophora pistillata]|uniref:Ribosome biogenesis protein YTM1 n=1 Tax=Stylophora pistillata TaxID=50429 RepID=A0A2B4S519_STYPI|nr:Ribosome biogenesis protein YTM1 [Stylophora pistillata]
MQLIETRTKRPVLDESELKVSSHWKLIKTAIQQPHGDDPKKLDEKQSLHVGHGVHSVNSLPAEEDLAFVAFNSFNHCFVGIYKDGKASVFLPTGYREDVHSKSLKDPICGIVYAKKPRFYVAWGFDENIRLMSDGFKVISVATSVSRIFSGVYNESSNEIITGGVGNLTCWSFRYGAKFLLQRKVLTDCMPPSCPISLLCLEDTPSRSQRCFAVYHNNVIIYNLLNGTCVGHLKELHPREITAMLFFNPLKYLITGAKDGSIKVWDDRGNIKIIFVGHLKSVNTLAVYPFGTYIMSGSSDNSIRVWSLDTADEVDRIDTKEPVLGLGTIVGKNDLYSFGRRSIELWKIEHIHSVFATVGSKIKYIKPTTHPRMPTRLVCTCDDATVRLLSPGSGECITTMLLPNMSIIVDVSYAAAENHTIKIWRLFPFAEEALAPLMTLYCHETPRFLSVAHHKLCAAFHEPATPSYNIVVFKTTQKKRFDHNSDWDHMDDVTGLASCAKMRLFASCSADGSVRIWDESNKLLRFIKLNATPTSICFSSQKGDLIVGIGKHLHKINYASYMPQSFIFRMVAMDFRRVFAEAPIEIDSEIKGNLTPEECQRLGRVKSSLHKYSGFQDILPQDEMDEKIQEEERRIQAFSKIQERESELKKLRDGTYRFSRKRPNIDSEAVRGEAFEKYLEIFYKRPHFDLPDDTLEDSGIDNEDEEEPYAQDRGTGFFSISRQSTTSKKSQTSPEKTPKAAIASLSMSEFEPIKLQDDYEEMPVLPPADERDEFSPSDRPFTMETESEIFSHVETSSRVSHSAPARRLKDFRRHPIEPPLINRDRDRYVVHVPKSKQYPSPSESVQKVSQRLSRLASHQNEGDEEMFVIAPDGFIPNSVVVAMLKDLREEGKEEADKWKPPQLTAEQLAELESRKKKLPKSPESPKGKKERKKLNFARQLQLALRDSPSPEPATDLFKSPTPTPPPSSPPVEPTPPRIPSPKKEIKPVRSIEKLISRPKPRTPDPTPSPSPPPPPPKEPTPTPPPPPPSPLPSFITQFKGTLWFDKFFPNANSETFPRPWTPESFVEILLTLIQKTTDHELKTQICAAIMLLHRQEGLDRQTTEKVNRTMIAELNIPDHPTAHGPSQAKQFLRVALQLSHTMRVYEVSFVAELMAQFIDGDEEIRKFVRELLASIGVLDTAGYFAKEMDLFDTTSIPGNRRKALIKDMCVQWLNKWLGQFRQHIRSLAGKISRAQAGSVVKGTKTPKTPSSIKGILKTDRASSQRTTSEMSKPTTISFDLEALGGKAADTAMPAEAINYFCEIRMEEELERARTRTRTRTREKTPVQAQDNSRSTVLVLPKIHSKRSLTRLGETHCSHCHPERETSLALAFPLPQIYQTRRSVVFNNMVLHLKTLTLNPFPDESDSAVYEPYQHSNLLTLHSSQKYFIPAQSYVEEQDTERLTQQIRKVLL